MIKRREENVNASENLMRYAANAFNPPREKTHLVQQTVGNPSPELEYRESSKKANELDLLHDEALRVWRELWRRGAGLEEYEIFVIIIIQDNLQLKMSKYFPMGCINFVLWKKK